MTEPIDTSHEAYECYLQQVARLDRLISRMDPKYEPQQPKTYDEWTETMRHRDHPLWPAYVDARRDWKDHTFHLRYSPPAARALGGVPTFPDFPGWLTEHSTPSSSD